MFCTKCGKQIPDGAKFCTGCGNQIAQSDPKQPQQPKMQPPANDGSHTLVVLPQEQQPDRQHTDTQIIPNVQEPNMSYHLQKTQETQKMENKNKRVMIVLFVILAVLVIVAIGMAVYYFTVLRKDSSSDMIEITKLDTNGSSQAGGNNTEAASETNEITGIGPAAGQEEEISDTNEVVKGIVLNNVPKSVYSYEFDYYEELGNAQVVIRNEPETMPEIAGDREPKYVAGMDGNAVYLDGSYGIRLGDVRNIGTSYTIAFWMKADDLLDWAPFIHIGYNLLDSDQRCRLWLGQKTGDASVAPIISSDHARFQVSYEIRPAGVYNSMQPGEWYHVAFTVDGTKQGTSATSVQGTLYVAGQKVGEGDVAVDTMNADNLDVYLGINCWDDLYPVAFDSVKIWDQVLDASQIEELFDAYK